MDLGCYCIHMLRTLFGEPEVLEASARTSEDPRIDDALTARLRFPDGLEATASSSLYEPNPIQRLTITGSRGSIVVDGFVQPQNGNRVTVTIDDTSTSHEVDREPTSYAEQLRVFVAAIREGAPILTGPDDSLATMRVIDDMYTAAGLGPREVTVED